MRFDISTEVAIKITVLCEVTLCYLVILSVVKLVEARFSTPVRTGPGTHPATYTMDTRSLSAG